ncbi:phosphonate ABC transporter, permease protein PhnE [Deinococcus radiomollis]|uniref:phosphonate ABC transporter, permease protein PhnE n=1 Tax=Deinococcus radiomollis TaxID=468916 RepID=UPI0038921DC9
MTTALLTALLIVGFVWLSRGSGRRLGLIGAVGLILAFVALPFVGVIAARTDQGIAPTALALVGLYPALWLAPLLGLVAFAASLRASEKVSGVLLTLAGLAGVVTAFSFQQGADRFLTLHPVPGVLEVAFPLALAAALYLLTLGGRPTTGRARQTGILVTALAPLALAALLLSGLGASLFPQLRGYYQTGSAVSNTQSGLIVKDWALDISDYLQADVAKRAQDWKDTKAKLAAPAAGTDRAKQRKDYYDLADEFALQRRTPGDVTPLPTTIAAPDAMPPGFAPGPAASDAGVRRVIARSQEYGFQSWVLFSVLAFGGGLIALFRRRLLAPPVAGSVAAVQERRSELSSAVTLALVVVAVAAGFHSTGFNFRDLWVNWPWITDFWGRATPPDAAFLSDVMREMLITINIALIGTVVAAVFALPLSLLAARNLTQNSLLTRSFYFITRTFFNVDRGVDTLILALILVAAVGLGPFAGALAMAVHSVADLGKLYSEAIENADQGPIEALESAGAPGTSVVRWGLLPQVLPLFLSYTLYRFEINFRVSIVLGFVGAGGIGFLVNETMRGGGYPKAMTAIIVIVLVVNILDFISAAVRRRLV